MDTINLELPDPATGFDLLRRLKEKLADALPNHLTRMLVVNKKYGDPATELKNGDHVPVIPDKSRCQQAHLAEKILARMGPYDFDSEARTCYIHDIFTGDIL